MHLDAQPGLQAQSAGAGKKLGSRARPKVECDDRLAERVAVRSLGAAKTPCPHLDHVAEQEARQVEQVHRRTFQQVHVVVAEVHLAEEGTLGGKPFQSGEKLMSTPERWRKAKVCDGHERCPRRGAHVAEPSRLGQRGAKGLFHQCRRPRLEGVLGVLGVRNDRGWQLQPTSGFSSLSNCRWSRYQRQPCTTFDLASLVLVRVGNAHQLYRVPQGPQPGQGGQPLRLSHAAGADHGQPQRAAVGSVVVKADPVDVGPGEHLVERCVPVDVAQARVAPRWRGSRRHATATGRTSDPVAPLILRGRQMKRNSPTAAAASSSSPTHSIR